MVNMFSLLGVYCTEIRPSEHDIVAISGHSNSDIAVDTASHWLIVNFGVVNC